MNLVLDLDETLITDSITVQKHDTPNVIPIVIEIAKHWHDVIFLRPYLDDFLKWANEKFDKVILCTFSSKSRVDILLRELELNKYFNEKYVYEDLCCKRIDLQDFILVDDCEWFSGMVFDKMRFLGLKDLPCEVVPDIDEDDVCKPEEKEKYREVFDRVITIPKFKAQKEDEELFKLKDKLLEKVGA